MSRTDADLRTYCSYWREMEYSTERTSSHVLARGCYNGHPFLVINSHGYIPCGYVNAAGTALEGKEWDEIDIDCHGGITFADKFAPVTCEDGWWIGWDYAHLNDYDPTLPYTDDGQKYDTADVVRECVSVIDQIWGGTDHDAL